MERSKFNALVITRNEKEANAVKSDFGTNSLLDFFGNQPMDFERKWYWVVSITEPIRGCAGDDSVSHLRDMYPTYPIYSFDAYQLRKDKERLFELNTELLDATKYLTGILEQYIRYSAGKSSCTKEQRDELVETDNRVIKYRALIEKATPQPEENPNTDEDMDQPI